MSDNVKNQPVYGETCGGTPVEILHVNFHPDRPIYEVLKGKPKAWTKDGKIQNGRCNSEDLTAETVFNAKMFGNYT